MDAQAVAILADSPGEKINQEQTSLNSWEKGR
jgi:hypothetical protein